MKKISRYLDKRKKEIIKVSSIAVAAGVFLALIEAVEGLIVGSLSMVLDGLSHVSEAGNAVIAAIGTYIAGKPADKKHPFGYGRFEYVTALIIGFITLDAGIAGFMTGVGSIINPDKPTHSAVSLLVLIISMLVRIFVGRHDVHVGEEYNSRALKGVGKNEIKHSILSAAALLSALVYMIFGVSIEAWIATGVSISIIIGAILILKDMLSSILGERVEEKFVRDIKKAIMDEDGVQGVYDLTLHNYGPDEYLGSVHIAVADDMKASQIDYLTRHISDKIFKNYEVKLTGIGVYSVNEHDEEVIEAHKRILNLVKKNPYVEQLHGFYMDKLEKDLRMDLVISFDAPDQFALRDDLIGELELIYPDYTIKIYIDNDFGMLA